MFHSTCAVEVRKKRRGRKKGYFLFSLFAKQHWMKFLYSSICCGIRKNQKTTQGTDVYIQKVHSFFLLSFRIL